MSGRVTPVVHDNAEAMGAAVAAELVALLRRKPDAVLGLATGSTPLPVYAALIAQLSVASPPIDLDRVHTFNLDEYLGLPEGHVESYRVYMDRYLFEPLARTAARPWGLRRENTHFPEVGADYDALIARHGGLDVLLLGIGVNGHVGFNEPGTPFDTLTRVVDLTTETRQSNARFFEGNLALVPTQSVTMGVATILNARRVLLMATGAGKAAIMARVLASGPTIDVPATALHTHAGLAVHLDRAAAAHVKTHE